MFLFCFVFLLHLAEKEGIYTKTMKSGYFTELHVFRSFSGQRFENRLIRSFNFSSYDFIARKILAMGAKM